MKTYCLVIRERLDVVADVVGVESDPLDHRVVFAVRGNVGANRRTEGFRVVHVGDDRA